MVKVIKSDILSCFEDLKHGFFACAGGVSAGVYESLNFGYGSDDIKSNVDENYLIAAKEIGVERSKINTLYQIHSNIVVEIDENNVNAQKRFEGDALITGLKGVVLGVLTADCVPVLFYAPDIGFVGAAHAGWKGAFSGVLENVVSGLIEKGAEVKNIIVGIMPAIEQVSYEVDAGFYEKFLDQDKLNEEFFVSSHNELHYMFNLKGYVKAKLFALGVKKIEMLGINTYLSDDCFSCRRAFHENKDDFGRHLSFVMLK
jgi:YfiH family protein